MTQFNQLPPKMQEFLITLQQHLPAGVPMTLDVNLSESWLHRYYIGVGGWNYEVWCNCNDTSSDAPSETWGYALTGYRPF